MGEIELQAALKSFARRARPKARSIRRAAVVMTLVLILGYIAFWFIVAASVERRVVEWTEARRAEGLEITHGGIATGGFPFTIELKIAEPVITRVGDSRVSWTAPDLVLAAPPWSLARIKWRAPGRHVFAGAVDATPLTLTATGLEGWAEASSGGIQRWEAWLTGGALTRGGAEPVSVRALLIQYLPRAEDLRADPPRRPLSIDTTGLALPEEEAKQNPLAQIMGSEIGRLTLDLSLVGPIAKAPWPGPALGWRDAGGVLEIKSFGLSYGPLNLAGEGTATIDRDGQPIGAFFAKITGYAETVEAFRTASVIDRDAAASIQVVLGVLARGPAGGPKHLEAPLTVQDRTVSLGPLKLFRLKPVDWFRPNP
ncbi:MAG: DUF2125 domain-containing protein [Rhodospirillaceae bacterium]